MGSLNKIMDRTGAYFWNINADGSADVKLTGSITAVQIGTDQAAVFANSDAANTQVNVDFTKPTASKPRYALSVYNPSTVTDITIKLFSVSLTFVGGTRYSLIDTIIIPKSQAITGTTVNSYKKFIEGLFVGADLRLVVSNNTVLGAAEGFSAYVRLREV
jgi:hypothetical protein